MSSTFAIIITIAAVIGTVAIFILDSHGSLNIKSHTVGDGQYGGQRWATPHKIQETFQMVPFKPVKWPRGQKSSRAGRYGAQLSRACRARKCGQTV